MHLLEAGFEDPDRPLVLLLHGFPELAYSWRKVMPALAAAGYHVIRVPTLGRVNAIWCAKGIQEASGECVYVADKRGFGYGVSVGR